MQKLFIALFIIACLLNLSGCTHSKKVGQTITDGAYNTYKAIEKADNWFRENYW
jgi:major membrane immunogen (membrane-anchored lipoprotein)